MPAAPMSEVQGWGQSYACSVLVPPRPSVNHCHLRDLQHLPGEGPGEASRDNDFGVGCTSFRLWRQTCPLVSMAVKMQVNLFNPRTLENDLECAGHFHFIVSFGLDSLQCKKNQPLLTDTETEVLRG